MVNFLCPHLFNTPILTVNQENTIGISHDVLTAGTNDLDDATSRENLPSLQNESDSSSLHFREMPGQAFLLHWSMQHLLDQRMGL